MNPGLYPLLAAQSLSAFADNVLLFAIVAIVLQAAGALGDWYVPALQSAFLVSFVALGPWVGRWCDQYAKPRVMILANFVKVAGGLLLLAGLEPFIGYTLVGVGAALYSPAKDGILPEFLPRDQLVKANAWMEGSTIVAILLGTGVGGPVADYSVPVALSLGIACFVAAILFTLLIPMVPAYGVEAGGALAQFVKIGRTLLRQSRARLAVAVLSIFWGVSATLRVILVVWIPMKLYSAGAGDIAELTLYLAVGVVIGALAVPRLIPLDRLRRTRYAALAAAFLLLLLALTADLAQAAWALFGIGIASGILMAPLNASVQELGYRTVGSGAAVAVLNVYATATMLLGVGLYALWEALGGGPVAAIVALGLLMLVLAVWISHSLAAEQGR
jgi:LPLT family lysophospholipid transporter-like MFS transporter